MVKLIKNPVSLQNIHFGKIVLTFMLVGMMILGNVEPVKASEPLYNYSLFTVEKEIEYKIDWQHGGVYMNSRISGYSNVTYNKNTGVFEYSGSRTINIYGNYGTVYTGDSSNARRYEVIDGLRDGWIEDTFISYSYATTDNLSPYYVDKRGEFVRNIVGTESQYPADGVHTDGYWYVRGSLVTPGTPTSITVPTSNLKVGNSFTVTWGTSSNAQGYELERSINGGPYNKIYTGTSRSYTDIVQSNWNTVTYRVRGYNGTRYSSYRTSITIIINMPPTITITTPEENSYFV